MNQTIEIRYRTKKEYCTCCRRAFDDAEYGEKQSTTVDTDYFFEYHSFNLDNKDDLNFYAEQDINVMVCDWVYNLVSEYIVDSNYHVMIEHTDVEKLAKIINEIIAKKKEE